MRPGSSRSIASVAWAGVATWVAYGAAEMLLIVGERWLRCLATGPAPLPLCGCPRTFAELTAPLFALAAYALVGGISTATLGMLARRVDAYAIAAATLGVAMTANAAHHGLRRIAVGYLAAFAIAIAILAKRSIVIRARVVAAAVLAALAISMVPTFARHQPAASGERRPNVILITLDTVRADHLSLSGYARDTT